MLPGMAGDADVIKRVLPRGRNALDRETVAASQQARLLEAMQTLVIEEGFAAVRVADLIATAGVAKPTFYEHYASKIACFIALIDTLIDEIMLRIVDALDPAGSVEERVEAGIGALVDFVYEDCDRARIVIVEGPAAGREAIERLEQSYTLFANLYVSLRDESRGSDPSIPPITQVRARAIVGAVTEPIAAMLRSDELIAQELMRAELVRVVTLLATSP